MSVPTTTHDVDDQAVARIWSNASGIPHPVLLTNRGPGRLILGDDVAQVDQLSGYELGPSSAIQWDAGRRLFARCPVGESAQLVILENAGSIFDAGAIASNLITQGLPEAIAGSIYTTGAPTVDKPRALTHATGPCDGTTQYYGAYDTSSLRSIQWCWRRTDSVQIAGPTSADFLIFYWLDEAGSVVLGSDVINVLGDNTITGQWASSFGRIPVRGPRLQVIVQTNDTTGSGGGTGGGSGGGTGTTTFLLGASGVGCEFGGGGLAGWMTDTSVIKIYGSWADASAAVQTNVDPIAPGGSYEFLRTNASLPKLNLAMGGIFRVASGETWGQAAGGTFDTRWQTAANRIAALWTRPFSDLYLDFAREMNGGTWNPWYVEPGDAANFKSAWARWAAIMRSTLPGVKLMLTYNDGTGSGMATPLQTWPTVQPPDICAVDTYNAWPHATDASSFNSKMSQTSGGAIGSGGYPIGLEAWRQQALLWGVPIALSEFANGAFSTDGGGGGDHPYWTTAMLDWCYTNAGTGPGKVHHAIWFNHGAAEGYPRDYRVYTGSGSNANQPLTSAAFRAGHSVA